MLNKLKQIIYAEVNKYWLYKTDLANLFCVGIRINVTYFKFVVVHHPKNLSLSSVIKLQFSNIELAGLRPSIISSITV